MSALVTDLQRTNYILVYITIVLRWILYRAMRAVWFYKGQVVTIQFIIIIFFYYFYF